jgi:hypothetical protein
MKITIELTEEAAACLWDDVTWGGQHPRNIGWIAQSYLEGRAAVSVAQFPPASLPGLLVKFREAHDTGK